MARIIFFLSFLLLTFACLQPTHAVEYQIINKAENTPGGTKFTNEIGVDYTRQTLDAATNFIWRLFQQSTDADRKNVATVTFIVEYFNGSNAVAFAINNEIHYSAQVIATATGDIKAGFAGVIYHEMAHIWQWNGNGQAPGGLIEGIADFVRLKAGFVPSNWVGPGGGEKWDDGYDKTARFLDYCNSLRNGFVAELNKKMRDGYSDNYFDELLGKTVDQLWSEYKAKYGN